MAELRDDGVVHAKASLETTAEPDRIANIEAEISRLLESFDDRLAAVNCRLDRVLKRRA